MNHSDVQTRMADYLDGELALDERALVDAHMDACESCAGDLSELHATIALLRSLPTPEPPPDLADNVIARIRAGEDGSAWQEFLDTVAAWLTPARLVIPATALAAAAGVLLVSEGQFANIATTPIAPRSAAPVARSEAPARSVTAQRVPVPFERAVPAAPVAPPSAPSESELSRDAPEPQPLLAHAQPPVVASKSAFRPSGFGNPQPLRVASGGRAGGVQPLPGAAAVRQAESQEPVGRERLLEQRLEVLRRDPAQFAAWLGTRSRAERDLWLTQFARFASERRIGSAVLQALRDSKDRRLESAAVKFAAVLLESEGTGEAPRQR